MTIRPILTLALAAALTGCGTMRRAQTVPAEEPSTTPAPAPAPKSDRILYPKHGDYVALDAKRGIPESLLSSGAPELEQKQRQTVHSVAETECPVIRFNAAESANIRVPGINPLPANGLLALPLDRMRGDFCYPYRGKLISDYGQRGRSFHTGVDIKAVPGDTIRAAFPGVVRMSKYYSGYGNLIVIQHYYGFETCYGHCLRNLVNVNDTVEAGTPIGLAGRTGRATTEHLHFEFRSEGQALDPKLLIDPSAQTLREGMLYVQRHGNRLTAYDAPAGVPPRDFTDERCDEPQPSKPVAVTLPAQRVSGVGMKSPSSSAGASSSAPVYYRVKKGDTLSAIARRYGTSVKKLCTLNGISEKALLQLNQRLKVK